MFEKSRGLIMLKSFLNGSYIQSGLENIENKTITKSLLDARLELTAFSSTSKSLFT
jgi:hypothetical protein